MCCCGTPGPWDVHSFGNFDTFEIHPLKDEHGTKIIAEINNACVGNPQEREANANLMAASPELLTALADLVQAFEVKMGPSAMRLRIDSARDVIAKARGHK